MNFIKELSAIVRKSYKERGLRKTCLSLVLFPVDVTVTLIRDGSEKLDDLYGDFIDYLFRKNIL